MKRVLIAGVGNVFFRDDGFGVEVARHLLERPLPPEVSVIDFGIRGVHLAFDLLSPPELLVVVDLAPRGGRPGELYVIEPELGDPFARPTPGAHGMNLGAVFANVETMGGTLPPTRIVGCEPADTSEGMGLSAPVRAAIAPAAALALELATRATTERIEAQPSTPASEPAAGPPNRG